MLTHSRLLEVLVFDPKTGLFAWRGFKRGANPEQTGARGDRYLRIRIDGQLYYGHRLAWFYVHGRWPKGHLDHRNQDKQNNSISNLREATYSQNQANRKTSKVLKGVTRWRHKFMAQITVNRKHMYLGLFSTAEEAHARYCEVAKEFFGDFHGK